MIVDLDFSCVPISRRDLLLFVKNRIFIKDLESPLILFYFIWKMKNKIRKKTLKKCDFIVLEKHIFEKLEPKSKDQVTYWEGTSKRQHLSKH